MGDIDTRKASLAGATNALRKIETADRAVTAAKRTHSALLITGAQGELQIAVDEARDVDVQWGQIGSSLGIARGNAYQRYRKKPAPKALRSGPDAAG